MTITFRRVGEADRPFIFELYASTRELELSQVPWTDAQKQAFLATQFEAQTRHYPMAHPDGTHEIICADGIPVGRLFLDRSAGRFHILDITIAPRFRNAGIGSEVLKGIVQEADHENKPVTIYVETFNPSLRLFERLGFRAGPPDGFQILLERAPAVD